MRATPKRLLTAVAAATVTAAPFVQAQLEEIIVTASKIESSIQDTPIAVSAFSQEQLDSQLINDTMNLQFSVPNMTMTRQNFTGADVRIRGIGTGAIGPAGDQGVGIHINGLYQTATRIFETQFFDTQRLEVLRGPQGTLYGRNTTGGVVNIITAKADISGLQGALDGTVGNYGSTQVRGMINIPLGEDFAIRASGMSMQRDGFMNNLYDGTDVDDRDIWSGRLSLRWDLSENTSLDIIGNWFEEDDSRMRSQKQACVNDPVGVFGCLPAAPEYGVGNTAASIGGSLISSISAINTGAQGVLGQIGLMTGGAFGNAALLNNVVTGATAFPVNDWGEDTNPDGVRDVYMDYAPTYFAEENGWQIHLNHDFGNVQAYYGFGYSETEINSTLDYEKGVPSGDWTAQLNSLVDLANTPALDAATWAPQLTAMGAGSLIPFITNAATGIPGVGLWAGNPGLAALGNGVPVLLPDDQTTVLKKGVYGVDESSSDNRQYVHELRFQTSFDGPLNGLFGAFYLDYENRNQYIVRSSALALPGLILPINPAVFPAPTGDVNDPRSEVNPYMLGFHNDTRRNTLEAMAVFGELYWDVTSNLRLTFGARYSEEEKEAQQRTIYVTFSDLPPLDPENNGYFYPEWEQDEFSWRVNATWNMSEATMMYANVASSFKSGGFNPISDGSSLVDPAFGGSPANAYFQPEFIDSFEIGVKTALLDGNLQMNFAGFYYDYQDLQQAKIVQVTALNQNSDAEITGLEADIKWAITPQLILTASAGWLDTEIGEFYTVDTANPNGSADPSGWYDDIISINGVMFIAPGGNPAAADYSRCEVAPPNPCPGYVQSLEGNQIAGSPELSYNLGLAYSIPLGSTVLTLATNYYWQDDMYSSNFNQVSTLMPDWSMWNASARLLGDNWYVEAWIKNIEDNDNVSGQYLESQVSGLFTNQFILDPQTYGLTLGYNW